MVLCETGGRELTTSTLWSAEEARRVAGERVAQGLTIIRIETPTGIVEGDEIAQWIAEKGFG